MTKRCPKKRFGKMRWSAREDRIVETVYPDYREMQRRMPARSYGAIRSRARKLGVATSRHVWTNQDMAKLRTLYRRGATRAEVAAAFPLLSQGQICSKAAHVRLVRVRRTPYALGVPPLDDVRRRAAAQGLTWRQLDTLAKTGRYFQQTTRRVDWQHLAHAIEMLGGTIEIIWFSDGTASPQFENG